jgi:hypothetical protein
MRGKAADIRGYTSYVPPELPKMPNNMFQLSCCPKQTPGISTHGHVEESLFPYGFAHQQSYHHRAPLNETSPTPPLFATQDEFKRMTRYISRDARDRKNFSPPCGKRPLPPAMVLGDRQDEWGWGWG